MTNVRQAYLFSALEKDQLERMTETSQTIRLDDGDPLFECGDRAERFFLVTFGQIKLARLSAGGDEKIIDIVRPGNTFAEALMFMAAPLYPVSASALGHSQVISFDNRRFMALLRESPDSCFRVMATMCQRLRGLIKEIDDLTLQSATTRVCSMLLRRFEEKGRDTFALDAPKGVIACRLSMKPETFSRICKNLTHDQVIEVHAHKVKVLEPARLRELAHLESVVGLEPEEPIEMPCFESAKGRF